MAKFRIGETRYDGEKLVEVAIQCLADSILKCNRWIVQL